MELAGRVAIVTGGAAGIGRAIDVRLTAEGATVVVADVSAESRAFRADMGVADDVRALLAFTLELHGRLDVLVNMPPLVPAEEIAEIVLDLVRDDSAAGRIVVRFADEPGPRVLPDDRRD